MTLNPWQSWTLPGATVITFNGLLQIFGAIQPLSTPVTLLALPVAAYEMILAVWLIAKGFSSPATVSEPVRTATHKLLIPK